MKIEIIRTKESDGNWIKVVVDGSTESCHSYGEGKTTEEKALARATEVYEFIKLNKGKKEVLKSEEV